MIISGSDQKVVWTNTGDEYIWKSPAAAVTWQQQLEETRLEVNRIVSMHKPDILAIKIPEYGQRTDLSLVRTIGMNAAIMLSGMNQHCKVEELLYGQMHLNSKNVQEYCLRHVDKPPKYWNTSLADAVAVALHIQGKR